MTHRRDLDSTAIDTQTSSLAKFEDGFRMIESLYDDIDDSAHPSS